MVNPYKYGAFGMFVGAVLVVMANGKDALPHILYLLLLWGFGYAAAMWYHNYKRSQDSAYNQFAHFQDLGVHVIPITIHVDDEEDE